MPGRDGDPWPAQWIATGGARVHVRRVSRAEALAGIPAPAKVNFGLAVTGRRTDGYHKLVTLMAPLSLADTVRVEPAASFSLVCDDPALATDDNLVLRAARGLQSLTGETRAARITLTKRIPVSAGLGGGSGDAAATLIALDALWGTSTPDAALLALARGLGADVPFALYGGAMVARGIGDVLTPAPLPETWLVLVVPPLAIPRKTAALYGALSPCDFGDGAAIMRQVAGLRKGQPLDLGIARQRLPRAARTDRARCRRRARRDRSERVSRLSSPAAGRRSRAYAPAKTMHIGTRMACVVRSIRR